MSRASQPDSRKALTLYTTGPTTHFGPSVQKSHCNATHTLLLQYSRFELITNNEQDFSASLFSMTQKNSSYQLETIITSSFPESPR